MKNEGIIILVLRLVIFNFLFSLRNLLKDWLWLDLAGTHQVIIDLNLSIILND